MTDAAQAPDGDWKRAYALCDEWQKLATDIHEQADIEKMELGREIRVDDAHPQAAPLVPQRLLPQPRGVHRRVARRRAALAADVRAHQVTAAEAARRKRQREELKAERAAEPTPARAQLARASMRATRAC
jgi:hypothetical protein